MGGPDRYIVLTAEHPNRKWWTLFAMCFALFMIMLDNTIVNVALPPIQQQLDVGLGTLEWTLNGYILAFAVLIPLGGKLGDRFGRKQFFIIGTIVFTVASAACAMSNTAGQLIASRVGQGVGAAMMNPLSLSIIVNAFPPRLIATAIGIWAGVSGLGLAIGPVLGGVLTDHFDWSAVFWVNVPIGIVSVAVALFAVDETRDPHARRFDLPGTFLVTGSLFALVWGLIGAHDYGWASTHTLGFIALCAVLMVLFIAREQRTDDPMIPLSFFSHRAFSVANVVATLTGFALFGSIFFITLFLQNVQGYSPTGAGIRALPMTMMILFVAPIAGKLNARFGGRALMGYGMLITSVGMFGLAQLEVDSSYNMLWPFFVLMGAGIAMTMPAVSTAAMNAVEHTKAGIASGVLNASRQCGGALGIAVLGSIGATVAARDFESVSGQVSKQVNDLVVGARGDLIEQVAGPQARDLAFTAFVDGMQTAMYVGAVIALGASIIAAVALRGVQTAHAAPVTAREPAT